MMRKNATQIFIEKLFPKTYQSVSYKGMVCFTGKMGGWSIVLNHKNPAIIGIKNTDKKLLFLKIASI